MYSTNGKPIRVSKLAGRSRRRLVLLAPTSGHSNPFHQPSDSEGYRSLIAELQAFRGGVYLKEGFLRPEDLSGGQHRVAIDAESWHLLVLESDDRICGCIRYRECRNDVSYSQLLLANSALARCEEWGERFKRAVLGEIAFARTIDLPYVELGGWALAESVRGGSEAVRMALATYALSQMFGGAVGTTTARQSGSGPVLKKIGGCSLEHNGRSVPPYYDPMYRCMIEVLRFYSWTPNPGYRGWIEEIKAELREAPVFVSDVRPREWSGSPVVYWAERPGETCMTAS
jgi:hypothetical protein